MNVDSGLIVSLAKTALRQLVGDGYWKTSSSDKFKKIENPILGLAVGDNVYTYDDDVEEMQTLEVLAVVNDVGYVLVVCRFYGPRLVPVSDCSYGRTLRDAVELYREDIEFSVQNATECFERANKLKPLLG